MSNSKMIAVVAVVVIIIIPIRRKMTLLSIACIASMSGPASVTTPAMTGISRTSQETSVSAWETPAILRTHIEAHRVARGLMLFLLKRLYEPWSFCDFESTASPIPPHIPWPSHLLLGQGSLRTVKDADGTPARLEGLNLDGTPFLVGVDSDGS